MSKNLVIVESPGKCVKIKSFLGADYKVIASVGHFMEIPKKGMNIDIKGGFEPFYQIAHDKKDVVKKIKEEAKTAEKIYLATDQDREGEAISYNIYEVLDAASKKKCKRISFIEISKKALAEAIKNASDIDMKKVAAQKARQVLDRLIGYTISPILWYTVGAGTSAGRVQSIALKMVCQREKEIADFKPQDFWYIDALMGCEHGEFWAKVVTKDKDNRYLEEKVAQEDFEKLKASKFKLDKIERKEKSISPSPPFDTSSMQTTCSSVFGWPIKKTASLSQSLYEQGKITYIRSDSFAISEDALTEVRAFIKENAEKEYLPSSPNVYHKKSKASAQEAHECIRPIHCEDKGDDISDTDAQKLYKIIRSRFIACQMTPMIVNTVAYSIKSSSKHDLIARGQSVKFDGWFKVYKFTSTKDEMLPDAKEKEDLVLKDISKTKHSTQPPPRYNEGSLVKKLESEGVGRPSTYASIMEGIQKRGYVEKLKAKKGALAATALGMRVFDYLDPNFKDFFMDVAFTASVEDDLDKIAGGEKDFLGVVTSVYNVMQEEIKKAKGADAPGKKHVSTGELCTVCKKGSIIKKHGKFGDFYSCDQHPTCSTIFVKSEDGKFSVKEKKAAAVSTGEKCTKCKTGLIVKRKGSYGDFFACNRFPSCKCVFTKNESGKFEIKKSSGWVKKGTPEDTTEDATEEKEESEE
jgi:DNA topoisomerase I